VGNPRISLSVIVATTLRLRRWRRCIMSKIDVDYELENVLKSKGKVFVLFYASWCPFSQMFLPTFEKYAQDNPQNCLRVKTDDKAKLCEKYAVDVVPTVLLFVKGKVAKRLDGAPGVGLDEKKLKKFAKQR
jgi:thioredoxin 1